MAEINGFSTASLITRSTNDVQQVQMIVSMGLQVIIKAPVLAVWAIGKILSRNWQWSLTTAVAVLVMVTMLMFLFVAVFPKFRRIQKLTDNLNAVTRENLTGVRVVRAYNAEEYQEEKFGRANDELTRTQLFTARAMAVMSPVMTIVMTGLTLAIYWIGAYLIGDLPTAAERAVLFGQMSAFSGYAMQVVAAFMMLAMTFIFLPRAMVSVRRIGEVLDTKSSIADGTVTSSPAEQAGTVEFRNVSFRYPGADENVIHDISFTARPGETTAIIGSTGSGKSTLVNLIPRFYDVTEGSITLDGVDIRNVSQHELREKLGYVPQKGILFSGDIASNIMFGNPEGGEEEMVEAAEIAQATEFIDQKPDGYKSPIAQGGSNVSGGQKQRLSIARAIAKHPEVFIFDDSFSALDFKTDVTLRKALKKRTKNSTVLIVAQRISTILNAEQIIVLDDGKIAGMGTHQELLKTCEVYQQIAASQLSESELKAGQEKAESGSSENNSGQQTADNGKEVPVHA